MMQPAPTVPSPAPPSQPAVVRAEYEVFYHHVVRNRTDRELRDVVVYLPVPPSDEYQQIADFRVECPPGLSIENRTDEFGTRMKRVALAPLGPGAEVEVGFSCVARLGPPVKVLLDPAKAAEAAGGGPGDAPAEVRSLYLRDHDVLGLKDPALVERAASIWNNHRNTVDRLWTIHRYVASNLKYRAEDGWDPAPVVLKRGSGSCSEFSYVFCALCRATGIPTRFVGGSICPRDAKLPYEDRNQHRWAEAYVPGQGWAPFDPTLDRGTQTKKDFMGTHHGRVLILTKIGDRSRQLGLSYIGSNSHGGETTRQRWFTWSQGTQARLAAALKLRDEGKNEEADRLLRALAAEAPGARAGREAKKSLSPSGG